MDNNQIVWAICLSPILLIYGLMELNRGWKVLVVGKPSLQIPFQIQIWLIEIFKGTKAAKQYEAQLMSNKRVMRRRGIYSILAGLWCFIIIIVWALVAFQTLK